MAEHGDAPRAEEACVYTTLIGAYETLNEQPVAARSAIRFICLTDNPDLRSDSWDIRRVAPIFAGDPIRSQRALKIQPHRHLPEFARSLYIDNSVILEQPPEALFALAADAPDGLLMPVHSYRDTVLDEFLEVSRLGLDDNARIFEQLNHYLLHAPEVLQSKPSWAAIMVRDHGHARLRAAMDIWAAHVMRYSRRDQLSLNIALHMAGIAAAPLAIDNYRSAFHSWPHIETRDRQGTDARLAASIMPLPGQLRVAEQRLAQVQAEAEAALRIAQAESKEAVAARQSAAAAHTAEIALLHDAHAAETALLREALASQAQEAASRASAAAEKATALEAAHQAVLSSTAWRATGPLRRLGDRMPGALRRGLRSALQVIWWTLTLKLRRRLAERRATTPAAAP